MYDKITKGIRHPEKVIARGRRHIGKYQNRLQGCEVMDEDWDNLLILDACRHDMFERLNTIPGTLESRRSKGSATREFVQNNYTGKQFYDTVYVTGNPYVSIDANDSFHELIHTWKTDWDDEFETVLPKAMKEAVIQANERYPNKRLVGHFMQPHHPFIGEHGRDLFADAAGNKHARQQALDGDTATDDGGRVWQRVSTGEVPLDAVKTAYDENLEVILPHIKELVDTLPGKTVVTSDHGNLLNEPAYGVLSAGSRRYAHPLYSTADALVKVPWLVCPTDERKQTVEEPPKATEETSESEQAVEDRLEALGYK